MVRDVGKVVLMEQVLKFLRDRPGTSRSTLFAIIADPSTEQQVDDILLKLLEDGAVISIDGGLYVVDL